MLVILFSKYTIPLNRDYSEVIEQVEARGRVAGITEISSGYKYDIKDVKLIHGSIVKSYEHLLIYDYSVNSFNQSNDNQSVDNQSMQIKVGNIIMVCGKAESFEHPGNPGQFDEYAYYRGKGYAYKIKASDVDIIDNSVDVYSEMIGQISLRISESFRKYLPEKDAGMMSAIVLGKRSSLDDMDKELYQDNGLMHLLAVSALHVSMITSIILWIMSKLPVGYVKGRLLVIVILCMYGSIAGYGVSCTRAIIMIICSFAANISGRSYDNWSALALSGIIILLNNPTALLCADYQLSYSAVIAINLTTEIINRFNIKSGLLLMFINSLGVSIGINVFTMPVILMNYYDIPLYSSLLNLFILPLMPLLFVAALISGVCGVFSGLALLSGLAAFLSGIVHYILEFQRIIMQYSSDYVYNLRITGCPGIMNVVIYYIIVAILVIILFYAGKTSLKLLCLLTGMFFMVYALNYSNSSGCLKITTLDLGQGDGIYIEFPDNKTMFIDGGSSDVSSPGKYRIEPFLYYNGRRKIDIWVITHGDKDHTSGFLEMLDLVSEGKFRIGSVWLADVANPGEGYCQIEERLQQLHIPIVKMSYGMKADICKCSLSCLNPVARMNSLGENEYSLVLLIKYGDFTALFTGDAEGEGERLVTTHFTNLINSDNSYKGITLLKVPHHGSANSSSEEFINSISPDISIISYGRDNRYGHPSPDTVNRLTGIGSRIYDTVHSGAITVISDGKEYSVEEYKK